MKQREVLLLVLLYRWEAHSTIRKSKNDMAWHYNHQQTPALEFRPGDKVFLDTSNI
jgi:hypothetical protein